MFMYSHYACLFDVSYCTCQPPALCVMQTTVTTIGFLPEKYDYCSVEVNGTEHTDVGVPLIYMAAGLYTKLD